MPTPPQVFADVAARYGVDPNDADAVVRFFTETVPTLPPEEIDAILDELLAREGAPCTYPPCYPEDAPLPSLGASPAAVPPLLAAGWRAAFRRLLSLRGRVRGDPGSGDPGQR